MSQGMLGMLPLSEVRGPRNDLDEKLAGPEGPGFLEDLKLLLRQEGPWSRRRRSEKTVSSWRKISDTAIEINFDVPPVMEKCGKIAWNWTKMIGWVRVERIGDNLYVGGLKVILHREPEQERGLWVTGPEMHRRLQGKNVLDLRIADALNENVHLIPESWEKDEEGITPFILFWAVGFASHDGSNVRCFYRLIEWCQSSVSTGSNAWYRRQFCVAMLENPCP